MELFCQHYQYLVQTLQPVEVTKLMYSEGLLNQKEFTATMNAPCDHIKNCMIVEHVRHQAASFLFMFLSVLQSIGSQCHVYNTLTNGTYVCMYVCFKPGACIPTARLVATCLVSLNSYFYVCVCVSPLLHKAVNSYPHEFETNLKLEFKKFYIFPCSFMTLDINKLSLMGMVLVAKHIMNGQT